MRFLLAKMKKHFIVFVLNLTCIFILFFIFGSEHSFLQFINSVFYISFLYLIVFLFLFTSKGGFFDGLVYGFRRFNHTMFHSKDFLEEWKERPLPSEKVNLSFYQVLKVQTGLLVGVLFILLVIFYL